MASDDRLGPSTHAHAWLTDVGLAPAVPDVVDGLDTSGVRAGSRDGAAVRVETERRLAAVIDAMADAFIALDRDWRVTYANREACRLNQTTRAALVGRDHWQQWPETVGSEVERQYRRVASERVAVHFEHEYVGAGVWHAIHAYPTEAGGVAVFYRNITAEKQATLERERLLAAERDARAAAERAAAALAASEARFRALIERAADAITVVDADGRIRYASPSHARVFGVTAEARIGTSAFDRVHPDDLDALVAEFRAVVATPGSSTTAHFRLQDASGGWQHVRVVAQNWLEDPAVGGVVINSSDVTDRVRAEAAVRESEAHFRHQALHDPLTGLANRALFTDRVAHAVARAARGRAGVAVLYLDLDGFKRLNDSLGHAAGDQCLVAVAGRLRAAVRADDTVARLGGDEFAVLLEGTHVAHAEAEAVAVATRVHAALRAAVEVDGHARRVGASIGIAAASTGEPASSDALLRRADAAMYAAKAAGGGRHAIAPREA